MSLVPSSQPNDHDFDTLRSRLTELDALLGERAAEFTRVEQDLAAFKISYRKRVGLLHDELDELEHAIAEAELGVLSDRLPGGGQRASTPPAVAQPEPPPRFTSDAVRKLFRDVAKIIHPDLAADELARDRRHRLMIEANRAYASGDEERLRWILHSWQQSPEAVQDGDPDSTRLRLVRRIAQIEEQLLAFASEMDALKESPTWKLKAMVDEAAADGKDLVREMVVRLRREIMAARNRLDAMRSRP